MSLVNKIKDMFANPEKPEEIEPEKEVVPNESMLPPREEQKAEKAPEPVQDPAVRETCQAPVLAQEEFPQDSYEVLIKAQPYS